MFEKQKIENLKKKIDSLREENSLLREQNKILLDKITQTENLVTAAENYSSEHHTAMLAMNNAKRRYEEALHDLLLLKKEYKL